MTQNYKYDLEHLKIVVTFHSYGTCINEGLREFLQNRVAKLVYIDHPFSICKQNRSSVSVFESGELVKKIYSPQVRGPEVLFYIKDVLSTLYFIFRLKEKFNLYIGIDGLNAFVGLILKRLGKVEKVVFYTIDYVPRRFKSPFLNRLYHFIDRICCYSVDCIWNLSPVMTEARINNGIKKERIARQLVVPQGNNYNQVKRLPFKEINRFDFCFMGYLQQGKGIEFVVDALPEIYSIVSQAKLVVIGSGPLEPKLKARVKELGIEDKVDFKGFVKDNSEVDDLMARCAFGLAPYEPEPGSLAYYADPGKIRTYLALGLPIVVTKVPPSAYEIAQTKSGIAIEYDRREFVRAVVKLLSDDEFYLVCRKNAIELGANYSWEKVFTKAFKDTFSLI